MKRKLRTTLIKKGPRNWDATMTHVSQMCIGLCDECIMKFKCYTMGMDEMLEIAPDIWSEIFKDDSYVTLTNE